jgi:AcrR family transcriptional regulator
MSPRAQTSPRKAPRQARSEATVDAVLEATARVLVKVGYDHASTNRIAAEAGVSVGSLYQYFPSKEALVAALVDRHMNEMIEVFEANFDALHTVPLPIAAYALVKVMLEAHRVNPKLHKVLVEQVPRVGRLNRLNEIESRVGTRVRAYFESRVGELRTPDLDLAVFVCVYTVEGLTHAAVLEHPEYLQDDKLAREITAVLLRYVMKNPPDDAALAGEPPASGKPGGRG